MLALVLPTLAALVFIVSLFAFSRAGAQLRRSKQKLGDALRARGLAVTGELDLPPPQNHLVALSLTRSDGVSAQTPADLAIGGTTLLTAPMLFRAVVVSAPLAVPDQVVCDRALAQPVFGAFPPHPAFTSDARFDARFGVFPAPSSSASGSPSYRDQAGHLLAWATPAVLANLDRLSFVALHVRDGHARLAFAPTSADGLAAAISVADQLRANVAHRSVTTPAVPVPVGRSGATHALVMGLAFVPIMMLTLVISAASSSMTFQDATERATFTLGANEIACPDGGIYSAGPGYRKQHRTHYCYQPNGQKTPAQTGLLWVWTWGSSTALGVGFLLFASAFHRSSRAGRLKSAAENVAALPRQVA
ncbi:hypothetical protein [Sorangium sp. So ce363]|uniref:hypothetical protein n=1 Tax=Sorangium sp. So ce363 TaxID=3133304 RepID=UPI003F5E2C55